LLDLCANHNRDVIIWTGGHGGSDGSNPATEGNGDGDFLRDDIETATKSYAHCVIKSIDPLTSRATWPESGKNFDTILAWCDSNKSKEIIELNR